MSFAPRTAARRLLTLIGAAAVGASALTACSTESLVGPQSPTRVPAAGASNGGFTVGWGVADPAPRTSAARGGFTVGWGATDSASATAKTTSSATSGGFTVGWGATGSKASTTTTASGGFTVGWGATDSQGGK